MLPGCNARPGSGLPRWPVLAICGLALGATALQPSPADQLARSQLSTGVLLLQVTDGVTGELLPGVAVRLDPEGERTGALTDSLGYFVARVPPGVYRAHLTREGYQGTELAVKIVAAERTLTPVAIAPTAPVVLRVEASPHRAAPGSTVRLRAQAVVRDGSSIESWEWRPLPRPGGVLGRLEGEGREEVELTLPGRADFKEGLLFRLGLQGRLRDLWTVLGLTPPDLEEAAKVALEVGVMTTSGVYTKEVEVGVDLSGFAARNPGLRNVPRGTPVLLHGALPDAHEYDWSLESPAGSRATLQDATTRNPHFVPDLAGLYRLSEGGEPRLELYAGDWRGMVFRQRMSAWPEWTDERSCGCHFEGPLEPIFEDWQTSGHSEIFRRVMDISPRSGESCFNCHAVGFNKEALNRGIDDSASYADFLGDGSHWDPAGESPSLRRRSGHWRELLLRYPGVARFANVQCENCHGPTDSEAHETFSETGAPERISLSAVVCGQCHQEPGDRVFEQWLVAGHSNHALAVATSTVEKRPAEAGECGGCHSAQGFLARTRQGEGAIPTDGAELRVPPSRLEALGLTVDTVEPVTCPVCHDPHRPGSQFRGLDEKVPVRMPGVEHLPSPGLGGAGDRARLCMSCHRVEAPPRDDDRLPRLDSVAAPHAPQSDVLMGRNAFFVEVDRHASHLTGVEDSCIFCHMQPVPFQTAVGYTRGRARHSMTTTTEDCRTCHPDALGDQEGRAEILEMDLRGLRRAVEQAALAEIERHGGLRLGEGSEGLTLDAGDIRALDLVILGSEMAVELETPLGRLPLVLSDLRTGEGPLLDSPAGQVIGKAAWNYLLIARDKSGGAHNPEFVQQVLGATMERIRSLRKPSTGAAPASTGQRHETLTAEGGSE